MIGGSERKDGAFEKLTPSWVSLGGETQRWRYYPTVGSTIAPTNNAPD